MPSGALLAPTMTIGQAPRQTTKRRSRRLAVAHSNKTTQSGVVRSSKSTWPDMLRVARAAQQAESSSHRASTLAQRRKHATDAASPAAFSHAKKVPLSKAQRSREFQVCRDFASACAIDRIIEQRGCNPLLCTPSRHNLSARRDLAVYRIMPTATAHGSRPGAALHRSMRDTAAHRSRPNAATYRG